MKRKGFTLVELLVVIAIIALLMGILMPALARVRQLAFRMTCGTNLSGIGKAMLIYANDNEDEFPKAGGRTNEWGELSGGWSAADKYEAYGISSASGVGTVTVTSSFYLLVKYADVTPKQFVCKGETDVREFKLTDYQDDIDTDFQLTDAWDFGDEPEAYCSYSYHWPFDEYALTNGCDPSMAIAADRNPWLTSERIEDPEEGTEFADFMPDLDTDAYDGDTEDAKVGNSDAHQLDGQNVLFGDSHVQFEKRSFCALENDNIYTIADDEDKALGEAPSMGNTSTQPDSREDSVLLQGDSDLSSTSRSTR